MTMTTKFAGDCPQKPKTALTAGKAKQFTESMFYSWVPTLYMASTLFTIFSANRFLLPLGASSIFWFFVAATTTATSELTAILAAVMYSLILGEIAFLIISYVFLTKRKPLLFGIACCIDILVQLAVSWFVVPPLRAGFWIGVVCNTIFTVLFFYFYVWKNRKVKSDEQLPKPDNVAKMVESLSE